MTQNSGRSSALAFWKHENETNTKHQHTNLAPLAPRAKHFLKLGSLSFTSTKRERVNSRAFPDTLDCAACLRWVLVLGACTGCLHWVCLLFSSSCVKQQRLLEAAVYQNFTIGTVPDLLVQLGIDRFGQEPDRTVSEHKVSAALMKAPELANF